MTDSGDAVTQIRDRARAAQVGRLPVDADLLAARLRLSTATRVMVATARRDLLALCDHAAAATAAMDRYRDAIERHRAAALGDGVGPVNRELWEVLDDR